MRMVDLRSKCWRFHRKLTVAIVICAAMYFIMSIVLTKGTASTDDVQGSLFKSFHGRAGGDEVERKDEAPHPQNRKDSSRKIHRIPHNPLPGDGIRGLARGQHNGNKDRQEDEFSSSSTSSSADNPQQSADNKESKPIKRLPQAIIIGVKKGGTRALINFISLHPDVEAAKEEVHFFDQNYEKGIDWYREQMPLTKSGQITIEKTPSYFITEDAPKRIRELLGKDIKLILVLRDPVGRVLSDFAQSVATGRRQIDDFERLAVPDPKTGVVDDQYYAVHVSTYDLHLSRWLEHFPRSQFLFMNGDELIRNPASQLIKLQEFLNIDTVINEQFFIFNSTKGFYCVKETVAGEEAKCLGNTKGRAHPEASASILHKLRLYFKPHNERLYAMIGKNFHWGEDDRKR